jgi:hypothetical protein
VPKTVTCLAAAFAALMFAAGSVLAQNYGGAIMAPPVQMPPPAPHVQTLPPNSLSSPLGNIHSAPEAQKEPAAVAATPAPERNGASRASGQ